MAVEISMYVVWVVVAIAAILIELHTQVQIGWAASIAAIGALIAHGVTAGDSIWIELVVFGSIWCVAWLLLFIFLKPMNKRIHDKEDGFLAYIGNEYKASKANDSEHGELKINDKYFRFISSDKIKKGDKVKVISIKGVTFKVEKVK